MHEKSYYNVMIVYIHGSKHNPIHDLLMQVAI